MGVTCEKIENNCMYWLLKGCPAASYMSMLQI